VTDRTLTRHHPALRRSGPLGVAAACAAVALIGATPAVAAAVPAAPAVPAVPAAPAAPAVRAARAAVAQPVLTAVETEVLAAVNAERVRDGLPALTGGRRLQGSARGYSGFMARARVLRHDVPRLRRLLSQTRHTVLKEDLAAVPRPLPLGSEVVKAWLVSPAHREALLDPQVRKAGVGVSEFGGVRYVTLDLTN